MGNNVDFKTLKLRLAAYVLTISGSLYIYIHVTYQNIHEV